MPVGAYLFSRVAMALLFGAAVVLGLFVLGATAAGVALYRWQWFALAGVVLAGVVPFCALGLAIGAWVRAQAAVAIVNLVYLPMAFLSGLWLPISLFPSVLQVTSHAPDERRWRGRRSKRGSTRPARTPSRGRPEPGTPR